MHRRTVKHGHSKQRYHIKETGVVTNEKDDVLSGIASWREKMVDPPGTKTQEVDMEDQGQLKEGVGMSKITGPHPIWGCQMPGERERGCEIVGSAARP